MHRNRLRLLGTGLALCSAGTAMSDVIIDSEHRAGGGIYTGLRLLDEVPANYALLAYAPMSGGFDASSAGTFFINGAAAFTFKKNPNNSPLGEKHVHLDILNAGAFDYDADSLGATSLAAAAQCPL